MEYLKKEEIDIDKIEYVSDEIQKEPHAAGNWYFAVGISMGIFTRGMSLHKINAGNDIMKARQLRSRLHTAVNHYRNFKAMMDGI